MLRHTLYACALLMAGCNSQPPGPTPFEEYQYAKMKLDEVELKDAEDRAFAMEALKIGAINGEEYAKYIEDSGKRVLEAGEQVRRAEAKMNRQ